MHNFETTGLPKHVGIIMDGNGRWAQSNGLPRLEGHRRGVENLEAILRTNHELGIQYLTVYAFSTENWQRPPKEVQGLFALLEAFLEEKRGLLKENGIKLKAIGNYKAFPSSVVKLLNTIIDESSEYPNCTLTLALNYSSRAEAVYAAKRFAQLIKSGQEDILTLNWEKFSKLMYTQNIPDPDLIIRTSGEERLSNFLLLQGAYAELIFHEKNWPEFKSEDYKECIINYLNRERRFGKTGEQLNKEHFRERKVLV